MIEEGKWSSGKLKAQVCPMKRWVREAGRWSKGELKISQAMSRVVRDGGR